MASDVSDEHLAVTAGVTACEAVAHVAAALLGPRSGDVLLVGLDGVLVSTNDGATALAALPLKHAMARVLVQAALSADEACGDGTTSVVVLAAALLREAVRVRARGLARHTVLQGLSKAQEIACDTVTRLQDAQRHRNADTFDATVGAVLASKGVRWASDTAVPALMRAARIACEAEPGSGKAAAQRVGITIAPAQQLDVTVECYDGFVVPAGLLQVSETPLSLLVCLGSLGVPEASGIEQVEARSPDAVLARMRAHVQALLRVLRLVDCRVIALAASLRSPPLPAYVAMALQHAGIVVLGPLPLPLLHALAAASQARVLSGVQDLLRLSSADALGRIERVTMLHDIGHAVLSLPCGAASLVVHGATRVVTAESQRALWDALRVACDLLLEPVTVPGAGACETAAAAALAQAAGARDEADIVPYAAVLRAAADALLEIPRVLARNAGADVAYVLAALCQDGTHVYDSVYRDLVPIEVAPRELAANKRLVYQLAFETAATLLRIDQVLPSHVP